MSASEHGTGLLDGRKCRPFLISFVVLAFFAADNLCSTRAPSTYGEVTHDADSVSLEDLMYTYKSDKSRDDHGYTKLYELIFSPIRKSIKNMTEVGIAAGQSLQAWYRYFPDAEIHGFDVYAPDPRVQANLDKMKPRVHTHIVNILPPGMTLDSLGFIHESMDLIVEDGPHSRWSQEAFLVKLWPLLKPGGMYIMEDVGAIQEAKKYFHDEPNLLRADARIIMEENDCIWVDTSLGHRAWEEWVRRSAPVWAVDHVQHNSYLIIIQKRDKPLRPMQMNFGNGAMKPEAVVDETGNGTRV